MKGLAEKYAALLEELRSLGSAAVAFSGGVDSTFLLAAAREVLGERALAVTARLASVPARELEEAERFCRERGIEQLTVAVDALALPAFRDNATDRCYHCKRAIFEAFLKLARERGLSAVVEGSNVDDEGDYRPGLVALRELGIRSPLRRAGLTKAEIRALSRDMGLPSWDKPSFACLASRFAYGEHIGAEGLRRVELAEERLRALGFRQYRVRVHGDLARLELLPEDMERLMRVREEVAAYFRELGFAYAALDLSGYRSGSMNEVLKKRS